MRHLWSEDERSEPDGEGGPFALLRVRPGLPKREEKSCQCMTSRPIDAAVVEAFLTAVSPANVRVATQVVDQIEQEFTSQRRQRELQPEQARYEARLAQRQYYAVDPSNHLVAAELDRRWNETGAAHRERAFAQAERDAEWKLTREERAATADLSRDLPAICSAEATTNQERKELLRWRALAENARRSSFTDPQNGASAHLCRNRRGAESRWRTQPLAAVLPVSMSDISAGGTVWTGARGAKFETVRHSPGRWSSSGGSV